MVQVVTVKAQRATPTTSHARAVDPSHAPGIYPVVDRELPQARLTILYGRPTCGDDPTPGDVPRTEVAGATGDCGYQPNAV